MPARHLSSASARQQRGVVLIVALIFLVVLTLLGITAMSTNTLEERMAGNAQELNRAFQTAESGLARAFADSSFLTGASDHASGSALFGTGAAAASVTYTADYWQTVDAGGQRTADTSQLFSQQGADSTTTSRVYYRFTANAQTSSSLTSLLGSAGYKLGPGK